MQAIAGKVFAYGGMFSSKLPRDLSLVALASKVYVYDPNTELWTMRETGGEWISPGISDTASVSINDALYVYGGCDLHGNVTNGLYRFDTESLSWYNLTHTIPTPDQSKSVDVGWLHLGAVALEFLVVLGCPLVEMVALTHFMCMTFKQVQCHSHFDGMVYYIQHDS